MIAMLRERKRQADNTEYIATILWSIGRSIGGKDYPFPTYSEFMRPTPSDSRTTEQIIGGLLDKLDDLDKEGGADIVRNDGAIQSSGENGS